MADSVNLVYSEIPNEDAEKRLNYSAYSFKVLKECPIIIALLFSLNRNFIQPNVNQFVPLIVNCILLQH